MADDELVWSSERGRRVDQSNLMSRTLKPAAVEVGIGEWVAAKRGQRAETWVGFHCFRHTCATVLFRSGWNAAQVCRQLGHSDPGVTLRRYVHLLDTDLPEPTVLASAEATGVGNRWATRAAETSRDDGVAENAEVAVYSPIPQGSRSHPKRPSATRNRLIVVWFEPGRVYVVQRVGRSWCSSAVGDPDQCS